MDLSSLSLVELQDLQKRIPGEIKRREESEKVNVLNELKALAQAKGFTLEQLLESKAVKTRKSSGTVAAKYRHPANPELQWTGRGRRPRWVEEWLQSGTLEAITI